MVRRVSKKVKKKYVFDTNIFIELFEGNEEIRDFFAEIRSRRRATTAINLMELYEGAKRHGKAEIDKIDDLMKEEKICVLPITKKTFTKAIELMKKYTPTQGLETKDALIASVCLEKNYVLVTIDNDFEKLKAEGLRVIKLVGLES